MKLSEEIKDLIFLSVLGELDEEEEKRLQEWLSRPGNRELYEGWTNRRRIAEKSNLLRRHHPDRVWRRIERKIERRPFIGHRQLYRIAAVLIFSLGVGIWLWQERSAATSGLPAVAGLNQGPVLRLPSGEEICLLSDSVHHLPSGMVNHQGGCLEYGGTETEQGAEGKVAYHEITVPFGSEYQMILPDRTKVHLNAGSSMRFPVVFAGNERKVYAVGEIYFEVARDTTAPFRVVSGTSELEVLGTSFNLRNYSEEPYEVTLLSGSVRYRANRYEVMLKPGEQVVVPEGGKPLVRLADVSVVTAWHRGFFVFRNASLEQIMKELGRWYGLEVFFNSERVKEKRFSIELQRSYTMREVVDILQKTGSLSIEVKNRTVIIEDI